MNGPKWMAIAGVAAAAFLLGALAVWAIEEPPAAPQETAKPEAATPESLDLRYAQAQVKLAEANLARVERANARINNAVAGVVVAAYREDLEVAKLRLQAAEGEGEGREPFDVWLRAAEAVSKAAERQWTSSVAANRRAAGAIHELDIERLRWRSEVAKLNLERGRSLADASTEAKLQWQADMLLDEIERLNEEVLRNSPSMRLIPVWRY
jgi:hypothetical protein